MCRIDRSATTASCASSSSSRNVDLSPGISPSWRCTIVRQGTSGVLARCSRLLARDTTVCVCIMYIYRCRFSVIPFASCRDPKEEQERFQESLSVTCRDYGLRRKIIPRLCSRFLCRFHREHETDRSTDPLIKTDGTLKLREEHCDACLCF